MTARVMHLPRDIAWCPDCDFTGPAQPTEEAAQMDADRHNEEVHR